MNISEFRAVANIRNALVVLDSRTQEIKVRRRTLINRTIAWLKQRISPNPMAGAERDAAHNRFLRAIADYSGYDSGDVSRAEALLSVDVLQRVPLSSRRIREVMQDLDGRSTQAMRDNRTTVAWMSSRGVDIRLREQVPEAEINEEERELLSARIDAAIHAAGGDGRRKVESNQASRITDGIVDAFLEARAARIEAEERARAEALARAEARRQAEAARSTIPGGASLGPQSNPRHVGAAAGPVDARKSTASAGAGAVGKAAGHDRAGQKELLRTLGKAKLPGNLKSELRKLVKAGTIADRARLVSSANQRTADWVMENRVGTWYGEVQKRLGVRGKIKHGEELMASETMLRQVTQSITGAAELLAYPDVEAQSRTLIAAHVRSEIDGQSS